MNTLLKRDQVNTILNNAPAGVDKRKVLEGLIQRGYELEGVDTQAAKQYIQAKAVSPTIPVETEEKSFGQKAKEVAVGVGKGVGATIQGIQDIGQRVLAGVDPTRDVKQIKEDTGIKSLSNADFKANTSYEKGGKALEFIGELLIPTGIANKTFKAGKSIFQGVESKLSTISDDLVEDGIKVKDKIGDLLANLDDKTKTALDRTPKEVFQKIIEQGKKAVTDDRIRTPLEAVGDDIIEALQSIKNKAAEVGSKKSSYLKYPDAFKGDGIKTFKETAQSFLNSRTMIENDKPIVNKIIGEFKKLGDTPSKGQVDKFIDYAQEALFSGEKNLVQPTSNKTVAQLKTLISKLNNNLKNQLPENYRKLNEEYSRLAQLSSELNLKLGKEGASAGSFVKRLFSPSDARTKELFEALEKMTGKDFSRDARLAKFIMETLGDTRAASILEQIPTSSTNVASKIMDFVVDKLGDPIKAAERYIKSKK
jgi:hypothetical protein